MKALMMAEKDTVAMVLERAPKGESIDIVLDDRSLESRMALGEIPRFHKVAVQAMAKDQQVVKYGEVIGVATQPIEAGEHVHTHNVISIRGSVKR